MTYTITHIADKLNDIITAAYVSTPTVKIHSAFYLPIESDKLPSVVIYPKGDTLIEQYEDTSHRTATFVIEIRAIGLPPITTLTPYIDKILKAIFTDSSLGGVATHVDFISQEFDGAVMDKEYSAAAITLEIGYIHDPIKQG
jgi:hypothetical protein